ncbi:response regulator transcription factor [Acidocella sp.]|uniref:response regulator transcription factor n=1 Tax=Acidocella sp. TaxID=50710 RepID=UPI0026113FFF|nr:response regulator transcription factor [Acidocella sp.]MDD2795780.1 response regulator transcription factor [Acidocella sp.]
MASQYSILVVDDDTALRTVLVEQLAQDGEFEPTEADSLAQAEQQLAGTHARFDLILLDISLPDGDGRDYCKKLRARGIKTPIILLTGHVEENDVVSGLDAGANDYVAKPFRLNELLARLRAQMRAFEGSEDAVFNIGSYTFRPAAKQLTDIGRNKKVRLTDKESAILKFLYRAAGKPVSRQVLLNEVWGYNAAVTTHTLETHIYRLRQKIELDPAVSRLLLTEGGGYRLNADGSIPAA